MSETKAEKSYLFKDLTNVEKKKFLKTALSGWITSLKDMRKDRGFCSCCGTTYMKAESIQRYIRGDYPKYAKFIDWESFAPGTPEDQMGINRENRLILRDKDGDMIIQWGKYTDKVLQASIDARCKEFYK